MPILLLILLMATGDHTAAASQGAEPLLSNIRQLIFEGRRSGEG